MKYIETTRDTVKKSIKETKNSKKKDKLAVNYSIASPMTDRCGLCEYFINNNIIDNEGSCELVKGAIHPKYWCELFERKDN